MPSVNGNRTRREEMNMPTIRTIAAALNFVLPTFNLGNLPVMISAGKD